MPIPKFVAGINKHVTNRFFNLFAGWLAPFAIVHHRGRRSGRMYRTPVMAFPTETGYVFALTYGRDVDWVKNLMTSDGGSLERKGDETPFHGIRFAKLRDVKEFFPFLVRLPLGFISVEDCLLVEARTPEERHP